ASSRDCGAGVGRRRATIVPDTFLPVSSASHCQASSGTVPKATLSTDRLTTATCSSADSVIAAHSLAPSYYGRTPSRCSVHVGRQLFRLFQHRLDVVCRAPFPQRKHPSDRGRIANVLQRIAGNQNEVGALADFNRPGFVVFSEIASGVHGTGFQGLVGREPRP